MSEQLDRDIETLFNALPCRSHDEIAQETGWTLAKVANVLGVVRDPDVSAEWGWTVPLAARGTGEHLFQAVLVDEVQTFTKAELVGFMLGAHSTLSAIATEGENEAHALTVLALQLPAERRRLRRLAAALAGVAAMAEEARESLEASLNGAG